mmetsp:Transcript_60384/g.143936  ORF Transcript_60384/g.143936 Transcript_60384/m.143936 type:complete len:380 (-) Transcript_60384:127-1266(-)
MADDESGLDGLEIDDDVFADVGTFPASTQPPLVQPLSQPVSFLAQSQAATPPPPATSLLGLVQSVATPQARSRSPRRPAWNLPGAESTACWRPKEGDSESRISSDAARGIPLATHSSQSSIIPKPTPPQPHWAPQVPQEEHAFASLSWGGSLPDNTPRAPSSHINDDKVSDEAALRLAQQEGPPGPAGLAPALPGLRGERPSGGLVAANRTSLCQSVSWLLALKAQGLPFDPFHLGTTPDPAPGSSSLMASQNISQVIDITARAGSQRWNLMVHVQRVTVVAGELDLLLRDPTGEIGAVVDYKLHGSMSRAFAEGATYWLNQVRALPTSPCRLLIMQASLVRHFLPNDVGLSEAQELLQEARQSLGKHGFPVSAAGRSH